MSTDIVKLDLFDGGSFKHWQKKPWLNPVNFLSSEMTISFDVATSSMLCRIHSWTYIKIIPVLGNFGKLSRNASSGKTQQVRNLLPDIAYAVGRLSRHTNSLGKEHLDAVNRVFKYLKKTMDYGLEYSEDPSVLEGYTDASWITDQEDCVSMSGCIFILGEGVVSWESKKQSCLTDFTMAADFLALASCYKEAEWLRDLKNLDKVHLSECGSEAASYELKGLALKHLEKLRYRPKASFNGSAQSGLNEREEGYA
ncbi:hypothetical protein Tco_1201456 [Tanacetum coccineum]